MSRIPKKIWCWWDGDIPDFVKKCILRWKRFNPSFEIIILNDINIKKYIDIKIFDTMKLIKTSAMKSDLIRFIVIYNFGGIWMDGSIILNKSLDWIIDKGNMGYDFVGYYLDENTYNEFKNTAPMIETWLFGAIPKCNFVRDCLMEFLNIQYFNSIKEYANSLKMQGINPQNLKKTADNYHIIYFVIQKILQKPKEIYYIFLLNAGTSAFKLQIKYYWSSMLVVNDILNHKVDHEPVIKLISEDRKIISLKNYESIFK